MASEDFARLGLDVRGMDRLNGLREHLKTISIDEVGPTPRLYHPKTGRRLLFEVDFNPFFRARLLGGYRWW
jgi:hypothetical protein